MMWLRSVAGVAYDWTLGLVAYGRIVRDSTRYAMQERLEWLAASLDVDYPDDDCPPFCADCPDHEACASGYPCGVVRDCGLCEGCDPAPDDVSALDAVVVGFGCDDGCRFCGDPA